MKVVYISTYVPRECGIGTFTNNLLESAKNIIQEVDIDYEVVAINDAGQLYQYPPEVKFIIQQENQEEYLTASDYINDTANCCVLEHEYGIFGGQSGIYILPLLSRLRIPLVVTLHTVLEKPSYNERAVLTEICKMASSVVVMSNKAIGLLQRVYNVPIEKIIYIPHGVPVFHQQQVAAKEDLNLMNKEILLTFGFIGRNKGIETVIKALPKVISRFPNIRYIVLGKTHPNVLKHSGEEYRAYLENLVDQLSLNKHVLFINEFIDQEGLLSYLSACDIYITPYINEAQITSGTLSYAIGAGAAVLSTPYWHAKELLKDGKGRLFGFKDIDGLSSLLTELLGDPTKLKELRETASYYGQQITWPKVAEKYINIFNSTVNAVHIHTPKKSVELNLEKLPAFSLEHIKRLTNHVGIIQHATYALPNYKEGYCLDDNARALLISLMAYKEYKDPMALSLMPTYLGYIHYMQRTDGKFQNFLSFNNGFLDKIGSEDSFGRAIWALGYLFNTAPCDGYYQLGNEMFFKAVQNFDSLRSIRGIAYTIIGICFYLEYNPNDEGMIERMRNLIQQIINEYNISATERWHWFEPLLAYDNAILPLCLLQSAKFLNDDTIISIGLKTMTFLENIILKNGYLSIVGNQKWYHKDKNISKFGQQPLDVLATVLMFDQAFQLTGQKEYLEKMYISFMWFFGENDLRISLYDYETKGCCDGLENYGVNRNQGAESTLSYLIAYTTVHKTFNNL
ncbi:glycosyltransferase family 4 protein [Olivibacter domesticus]|uniref:Glycosyltransferase involved in cell wall bisynthesis n=1 Tax=Olivibacter domesticus TaxID=407022 RepID=A0A1H7IWN9_OLID1|nr:glycosyltransferase family 4 protein [Olivibacter domesticus]SEK66087.1 Glycosyltransferase involved in cell wall bisynthesis [Olivibacter domesticus]